MRYKNGYAVGEFLHIQIGCELARKFNVYTNLTGLKKAHVIRILLERFLAARNKNEKSINISLC